MSRPADWTKTWAGRAGISVWFAEETQSTNAVAKNDETETKPSLFLSPTVYLANQQTAGRGRGTHTWTAPSGALLSSWSFAVESVPQPIFSALVGLALFEACADTWPGTSFNIKAPNDLFIGDKKTAGILIETVDQGREKRTVVGVGFNVFAKPDELATATCLSEHASISERSWNGFLDRWVALLREAVRAGAREKLSGEVCTRLCGALNLHPLLKEPILRVDELGQLHSASRIVHWHEL